MSSAALQPLWQIEEELAELLDCVATCDEELQPELQARIAAYTAQSVEKIDQVAHVLAALEYEQKAAADEITRLQERKASAAKALARLEGYVCRVIQARGVKALKGTTNTLSVRPSDAVVITDEAAVPEGYQTATVSMPMKTWATFFEPCGEIDGVAIKISINKAAIKKALKSGEDVAGCDLEFHANLVRR